MKRRGRPVGSATRQCIVDILSIIGKGTGYDIYKIYKRAIGKVTPRTIYYNLHTGVLLDIFVMDEVRQEEGDYSWGPRAEKKYYALGRKAKVSQNEELLEKIRKAVES